MDGFACSSWYFLRFASPHDERQPFDPEAVRRWLPVDIYVGGAEHAVMHLLYARFWTKVMHDAGLIDFVEPFTELRNQGMMLSAIDGHKMSKSKGNVVTPDEVVTRYGTDVLRTFLLFLGPFDTEVVWDERGIVGVQRFLERYWNLARDIAARPAMDIPPDQAFERKRHQTIRRISQDMERFRFNTAVAGLMEYVNDLYAAREKPIDPVQWRAAIGTLTQLLAPIAPFITEEVWRGILGENESVHRSTWPEHDEALAVEEQLILVVQVNGKLRDRVLVPASSDDASIRDAALSNPKVRSYIGDRPIQSIIVVPGRLVNVVVA
jgi:leucyl-tRNA synthetase